MDRGQARLLLGLVAALIALVVLLSYQGPEVTTVDPEATEVVWPALDPDEVERVVVVRAHDSLELERRPEGWWLVGPEVDRADAEGVRELLDDLREIQRGIPVQGAAERAAEFGLGDPPDARVIVTLSDGMTQQADVGIAVPVGYRTYARSEAGEVVAVNGDANETLQRRAAAYRDHRVFRFDPARVRRVRISGPAGVLEVHGQGVQWWLEGHGRADPHRVDDLVMGLLDLRFDVVLGLDEAGPEPTYTVSVTAEGGDVFSVRTGTETPMGVLTATSDARVGAVFAESLALLGQGPRDIADPAAIPLDLQQDDRVELHRGGTVFQATRNGPTWSSADLDDGATWVALQALSEVPSVVRSPPPDAPVAATWVLQVERQGRPPRIVRVGQRVEGEFRTVQDDGGGLPYRVVAADLESALALLFPATP